MRRGQRLHAQPLSAGIRNADSRRHAGDDGHPSDRQRRPRGALDCLREAWPLWLLVRDGAAHPRARHGVAGKSNRGALTRSRAATKLFGRKLAMAKLSEADVKGLLEKCSNWGRWGKDDERGALNYINDRKRAAAAKLVQSGEAVSMALPLATLPAPDNPTPVM